MRKLKTVYLDLVLLHQPFSDIYGTWRALEELYGEGRLRPIGVPNFYVDRMVDFASLQGPKMVEWFVQMAEARKKQHDRSKEKKSW